MPGLSAVKIARIVLYAAAIAHFPYHLHVIVDSLFYALSLDEFAPFFKVFDLVGFVQQYAFQHFFLVAADDVLRGRENERVFQLVDDFACHRVYLANAIHGVAKHLHTHRHFA